MKKLPRKNEGFTLIELLIVVAIIGIIAGIAIPNFLGARTKARVTRAFADMRALADALEMYFIDEGKYPVLDEGKTDLGDAAGLDSYITSIPKDPFGTEAVPNFRYYCDGDADTMATMWLLVSNGPDGTADVTDPKFDKTDELVSGELGGPNGAIPEGGDKYYNYGKDDWSQATSTADKGDIGRGGP